MDGCQVPRRSGLSSTTEGHAPAASSAYHAPAVNEISPHLHLGMSQDVRTTELRFGRGSAPLALCCRRWLSRSRPDPAPDVRPHQCSCRRQSGVSDGLRPAANRGLGGRHVIARIIQSTSGLHGGSNAPRRQAGGRPRTSFRKVHVSKSVQGGPVHARTRRRPIFSKWQQWSQGGAKRFWVLTSN